MGKVKLPFGIASGRTPSAPLDLEFFKIEANEVPSTINSVLKIQNNIKYHSLIAKVRCGTGGDGPPGMIHGGLSAWILDECMGATAWINDYPCVASKLEYYLKAMAPINQDLIVKAQIKEVIEDQIMVEGNLILPSPNFATQKLFELITQNQIKTEDFKSLYQQIDHEPLLVQAKAIFHILKKSQFIKLGALDQLEAFEPKTVWKYFQKN